MSKKINSVELEKIIAEELEKALVDEGFFSRVKAALAGYNAKKQEEENSEKLVKIVGLIGDYIQANRKVPEVMKAIENTEIVKKLGLREASPSSYEAELQAKGVNQNDVNQFLQAVKDIQSAKDFFKELLPQSAAQQPASAQQQAQSVQRPQAQAGQQTAEPEAGDKKEFQTTLTATSPLMTKESDFNRVLAKYKVIFKNLPQNDINKTIRFLFDKNILAKPPESALSMNEEEQMKSAILLQKAAPMIKDKAGLYVYLAPLIQTLSGFHKVKKESAQQILWKLFQMKRLYLPQDWKTTIANPETAHRTAQEIEKRRKELRDKQARQEIEQAIGNEITAGLQEQKDRWQELAGILKD